MFCYPKGSTRVLEERGRWTPEGRYSGDGLQSFPRPFRDPFGCRWLHFYPPSERVSRGVDQVRSINKVFRLSSKKYVFKGIHPFYIHLL